MLVLKFGGSSVADAQRINAMVAIVLEKVNTNPQLTLVVSAFGGTTDDLLNVAELASASDLSYKEKLQEIELRHLHVVKELFPIERQSSILSMVKKRFNEIDDTCKGIFLLQELSPRTLDSTIGNGELLSSLIIAEKFKSLNIDCLWKDARELIITDAQHGSGNVDFIRTEERIQAFLSVCDHRLIIMPGFIAADARGVTTTLGRGGSDYTAAIFAAASEARALEIWTDVSGIMTADPRLVSNARIVEHISYREAMELSHFGAKVIYPPTIQPVLNKQIPIRIKNTFDPAAPGTLIDGAAAKSEGIIRGISSINKLALLSLEGSGMVGIPGFSKRLFETLSNEKINVILITQSSSEHSICVGIEDINATKAKEAIDKAFEFEIEIKKVDPLAVERNLAILALVGDNMKSHPGISGKMFGVLGRNGVNIRAIAQGSSERNISAVISSHDVRKAINVLHEEFFETSYKQVNLFIAGVGNVGSKLLAQLDQQAKYLYDQLRLQVRVIALSNSRKMLFDDEGIKVSEWRERLEEGEEMNLQVFFNSVKERNLRNSVFVDITANDQVASTYKSFLEKSVSIVACNKIAASSTYQYYKELKELAREFHASFLFETNVGAGLPVIGTLNELLRSGDKITRIEAVLSGTLNFVFNNYTGDNNFADVVREAQVQGYTEPDPRLDLSGKDVMRKILILARETGEPMESEDINNDPFMPESCMQGDVENFYAEMLKHEPHFKKIVKAASDVGTKLKFVAKFEDGHASVGLQQIPPQHDFYHLYGKDNAVLFYTNRYSQQPLVIKGAGAGADVTASGIFADIIRAAST